MKTFELRLPSPLRVFGCTASLVTRKRNRTPSPHAHEQSSCNQSLDTYELTEHNLRCSTLLREAIAHYEEQRARATQSPLDVQHNWLREAEIEVSRTSGHEIAAPPPLVKHWTMPNLHVREKSMIATDSSRETPLLQRRRSQLRKSSDLRISKEPEKLQPRAAPHAAAQDQAATTPSRQAWFEHHCKGYAKHHARDPCSSLLTLCVCDACQVQLETSLLRRG